MTVIPENVLLRATFSRAQTNHAYNIDITHLKNCARMQFLAAFPMQFSGIQHMSKLNICDLIKIYM